MIGKLSGTLDEILKDALIIDVNGVGYKVHVPLKIFSKYFKKSVPLTLYIHTYVRDDILNLYGFETQEELKLFEKLLSISGIGAKISLAVISAASLDAITAAVANADVDFFMSIPGIGKKNAQRIIVELKPVLGDKVEIDFLEKHLPAFRETLDALKHFGFSSKEASSAIAKVKEARKMSAEQLLKEALKILG